MNANPEALKKALEGGTSELCGYFEAHTDEEIHADILALVASGGKGLRDEFAMAALAGLSAQLELLLANNDLVNKLGTAGIDRLQANKAFRLADAMLAARSKQGEGV